jgi:hypothetical protein
MKYRVPFGYRVASNYPAASPLSTHRSEVIVEAESPADAQTKAIVAAYKDASLGLGDIEHVRPGKPELVNSD